ATRTVSSVGRSGISLAASVVGALAFAGGRGVSRLAVALSVGGRLGIPECDRDVASQALYLRPLHRAAAQSVRQLVVAAIRARRMDPPSGSASTRQARRAAT